MKNGGQNVKIKYQFFEDENLFIQKYSGSFSIEKYQAYTSFIVGYITTKPIKKVLIDFREFTFSDITEDFSQNLNKVVEIRKRINENELKNKEITLVFWVNKPMPTVIAHLFSRNFDNYNYCSTKETVFNTLNMKENIDIENIIQNLGNSF